ncbi:ABC transporter substrate-binding protein [Rhodospira trueperi]|uniref:Branched-chain amino acid transport system substrate-binding protein n=1 Tax=Rhodospira trueperi TaxID=69960 RepID=A0A1G6ZB39_9PROT|nr:ABC transporter substrate-binding protein [Rhodospira trueperi]SDD99858.1 branched-chain amino acid transport system substrate-binding protein [Rhodospira trueperi]
MSGIRFTPSRRAVLGGAAAAATMAGLPRFAIGSPPRIKVGFMLPYSGTYAKLGNNITDAFMLRMAELGDTLGGAEVEFVRVDDESAPPKAVDNITELVLKEEVDVVVGTVHSGVVQAMAPIVREEGTLTIVPNAGANRITRELCAPNLFRTSFSSWQANYPCGDVVLKDGHKKVVLISWNYAAGKEMLGGFTESFTAGGGEIVKEILLDFPNDEFQAYLTDIAALQPDAVYAFFSGGGALKFIKDYAAAGLHGQIPLYGPGFLTEGVLGGVGDAAEGIKTTLHYSVALDNPLNLKFREAFQSATGRESDVFAVQGYDTATLLAKGLEAVQGDISAKRDLYAAMEAAEIESPRGTFRMSKAHNPIQDIYLREVRNGQDHILGVAAEDVEDPATGCSL